MPPVPRFPEPVSGRRTAVLSGSTGAGSGAASVSFGPVGGLSVCAGGITVSRMRWETVSPVFTPETQQPSSTAGGTASFSQHPSIRPATPART